MVVFKQYGWLGNQIFQYCALRSLMKDSETLIMVGCHQFDNLFQGTNAIFVNQNTDYLRRIFLKNLTKHVERFAERGLYQTISENTEQQLIIDRGTFNVVKFAHLFFQQLENSFSHEYYFDLSLKPEYISRSKGFIDSIQKPNSSLYFIHVRRGDYLTWKSSDKPAVLPESYYTHCIREIRKKNKNALFIACSDDKEYINKIFSGYEDIYISEEDYLTDFAIMRQCEGGILSASSFSWWAAFYLFHTGKEGPYFAPEFWIGHRKSEWYPKHFQTSFLNYINVHEIGYSDE